jgi:hypothetical protein
LRCQPPASVLYATARNIGTVPGRVARVLYSSHRHDHGRLLCCAESPSQDRIDQRRIIPAQLANGGCRTRVRRLQGSDRLWAIVGAIAGVIGSFIALGAWWLPQQPSTSASTPTISSPETHLPPSEVATAARTPTTDPARIIWRGEIALAGPMDLDGIPNPNLSATHESDLRIDTYLGDQCRLDKK